MFLSKINHTFEKQQKWYKVQSSKEYTCAREVAEEAKFSSWTAQLKTLLLVDRKNNCKCKCIDRWIMEPSNLQSTDPKAPVVRTPRAAYVGSMPVVT